MNDNRIKRAIDTNLSSLWVTDQHAQEIIAMARKEEKVNHKKHRLVPAFSIVVVCVCIGLVSITLINRMNVDSRSDPIVAASSVPDIIETPLPTQSGGELGLTSTDKAQIQYELDFSASRIIEYAHGSILLAGSTGEPRALTPLMLCLDADGATKWQLKPDDLNASSLYRDVIALEDNTIIALRVVETNSSDCMVEFIQDGKVVRSLSSIKNAFRMFPADHGFLIFCKPNFSSAQWIRMDSNGEELWRIEQAEPIMVNGLLRRNGEYIAYGQIEEGRSTKLTSLLFSFDDQGTLLWRLDGTEGEEYVDAVLTDKGDFVLIGNAYPQNDPDAYGYGFITSCNESGEIWKSNYAYTHNQQTVEGLMKALTQIGDEYLVATRMQRRQRDEIKMLHYNQQGGFQREWSVSIGIPYTDICLELYTTDEAIRLVTNGFKWKEDTLDEYMTIVKDIPYP